MYFITNDFNFNKGRNKNGNNVVRTVQINTFASKAEAVGSIIYYKGSFITTFC